MTSTGTTTTVGLHPKTGGAAVGALFASFTASMLAAFGVHVPADVAATGGALLAALGAFLAPAGVSTTTTPPPAPAPALAPAQAAPVASGPPPLPTPFGTTG